MAREGTSFKELHPMLISKLLALFWGNLHLCRHVALGGYEHLDYIGIGMLLNLPQPCLHIVKCLLNRAIIGQYDSIGALIVTGRDGPESLLPRRVPNLQLHPSIINHGLLQSKVNPYNATKNNEVK